MADIVTDMTLGVVNGDLLAGERLRIVIANSDGTDKTVLLDVSVPTGKTCRADISHSCTIS